MRKKLDRESMRKNLLNKKEKYLMKYLTHLMHLLQFILRQNNLLAEIKLNLTVKIVFDLLFDKFKTYFLVSTNLYVATQNLMSS